MEGAPEAYEVACHNCQHSFDAMAVPWCSCLVAERTLVCPSCLTCFCKAPAPYKRSFWSAAPRGLWDRKFAEHHSEFVSKPNPAQGEVVRPLVLLVDDEQEVDTARLRPCKPSWSFRRLRQRASTARVRSSLAGPGISAWSVSERPRMEVTRCASTSRHSSRVVPLRCIGQPPL